MEDTEDEVIRRAMKALLFLRLCIAWTVSNCAENMDKHSISRSEKKY